MRKRVIVGIMLIVLVLSMFSFTRLTIVSSASPFEDDLRPEARTEWGSEGVTIVNSVCSGDANNDGDPEIITVGRATFSGEVIGHMRIWSYDGAALIPREWTGVQMNGLEGIVDCKIANVDGDPDYEIVILGENLEDGRIWSKLMVWRLDEGVFTLEWNTSWQHSGYNTRCGWRFATGDVDDDGINEIVTGGGSDNPNIALLMIWGWDGDSIILEKSTSWITGEIARVHGIAVDDIDGDGVVEIISAGESGDFGSGVEAQLRIWNWNSEILTLENSYEWQSNEGHTRAYPVAASDVDDDGATEIIVGGQSIPPPGNPWNRAQGVLWIFNWNGATLAREKEELLSGEKWYGGILDISVGDLDKIGIPEISMVVQVFDNYESNVESACIRVWHWCEGTLTLKNEQLWRSIENTQARSAVVGDPDTDQVMEILTGGFTNNQNNAQLSVWRSRVLTVDDDGPANFNTIQAAINAASPGDIILVRSGTYREKVLVTKTLTLTGESRSNTIINGSGFSYSGALVEIIANYVDMSGFTVTNAQNEGIRIEDSQYCEVHENTVCFTGDRGIRFESGGNNKARNNIVYNSSAYGGIEAIWSNNNEISHNIAYFNRWGIATNHGSNNLIFNNTVYSNREHGIYIDWPSTSNIILNNSITSNPNTGIRVNHGANGTEMSGNSILGNLHGIRIDDSFYNRILENNITDNTVGIDICASSNNTLSGNKMITNYNCSLMLSSSSSNVISGNNIIGSGDGITLGQVSENNRVYHNNFINSTSRQVHICTPGYVNFWDDGYPSGGNYWSDYTGEDFYSGPSQDKQNEDGIGDTPYVIDENNQDNYPFMRPWPLERSTLHPWPMFHHDLGHTGYTESPAPNTNQTLWNFTTGGIVYGSVVAYGRVYVGGSGDKNVYCLDAFTGALVWNYTTGDWVSSSPAVVGGRVYVGSDDRNVYCLDAFTGALIWNYTTGYWVFSSPAVADGKVYVGSCDNNVYCLDALTGAPIWKYTTGNFVRSCPAVVDGRVYVGSDDNKTYCLDALTGTPIWNYTTGDFVGSSPAVVDGRVYVGSYDKNVYCLDALTGVLIWNYTTGSYIFSSPAVVGSRVYVGSCDNKTYCLDALTGAQIWNYTTGYYVTSSPAVADGKVYVGSYDFNVYCLNASTGSRIWSYTTGDWVHSSPAVADGVVYVGSDDCTIYAFGNVIRVPEDFQTIQEAINNATAGATIIIEPGIYNESIVINKTLTILGKKGSSTTFAGGGSGIAVTIQPTAPGSVVANVVITYYDKGILVNNTRDCKIYDNIMFSMVGSGIAVEGNNAANNLIKNNIVYSNNIAINLTQSSTSNTLYNNTISLNNIGLNIQSSGNIIYGNTISENDVGIKLSNSDNNIIYWNSFVNTQQLAIQTPVHGNVWDNGYPAGGNYWSDYTGEDANSDGIGDTPYIVDGTNQDNYPLMNPIHEIAVTGITPEKTVVEQGFSLRINIGIANLGKYGESFRLKLHAGSTMIVMFTDITLASRDSTTITFTWKTTGFAKGNYIISAVAEAVPGEVHMADNSFADGGVMIAMVGDLTGPTGYPDGKCDIRDIAGVAKLFGVNYPDPRYKPNYDITGPITGLADGKIDIRDVALVAKQFGKIDP